MREGDGGTAVAPHFFVVAGGRGGGAGIGASADRQRAAEAPSLHGRVRLILIAWDDPAARIPLLATQPPQDSVNDALPRPAVCDIVIVVLWARMGTPLPDNVRKPNGTPYLSGTEWEYEDAVIRRGSRHRRCSSTGGRKSRSSR